MRYFATLTASLGRGHKPSSILANVALAIIFFFYVFTVASFFKLNIVPLEERITDPFRYFDTFVFNEFADHVIIGLSTATWLWFGVSRGKRIWRFIAFVYAGATVVGATLNPDSLLDFVALISVPVVVSIMIYNYVKSPERSKISKRNSLDQDQDHHLHNDGGGGGGVDGLFINYLLIIGIAIGILALVISVSPIFSIGPESIQVNNYAYDIFMLFSRLSPFYMFLIINAVIVKIVLKGISDELFPKLKGKNAENDDDKMIMGNNRDNNKVVDNHHLFSRSSSASMRSSELEGRKGLHSKHKFIYLALFMALSIILAAIPQLPSINKGNWNVGDDTPYYAEFLQGLAQSNSPQEFLRQAVVTHGGDRPLTLMTLFAFVKIVNVNQVDAIEYFPMLLAPGLVLAVYFLTREMVSSKKNNNDNDNNSNAYRRDVTALMAAFLTAVSFQLFFGLQGGIYANFLALIIGYLCITFLFRFLKARTKLNLAIYSALMLTLLFTHAFTWIMLSLVMLIFLIVILTPIGKKNILHYYHQNDSNNNNAIMSGIGSIRRSAVLVVLLVLISAAIAVDIGRTFITGSPSAIQTQLGIAQTGLGPEAFADRWHTLNLTVLFAAAGLISNFIILGLALFWVVRSNSREWQTVFLIIFLSTGIIPIYIGDWVAQSRTFYNIPFQIPAAIALMWLIDSSNNNSTRKGRVVLILATASLWLVAIGIYHAVNIVADPATLVGS